ncbi:hypothetical protein Z517_02028 [Fonsecaea pedrosoi CBS 271.37]|uniref:Unplaced genomic scaffold supercont1.2, whole genome shotgun sequence n=1 Tax=Fonsecaea pedrosoi CBS 271.37 TaxID=1442368 RepID=A0A0D2GVZ3_9EURO|nr:uncharacterized protein Z517_02028 [Fonsecaea pedrosoi CBS 271.37]KIW82785.1 hypothetical protein Z517_02028 [Fonsecaea pedrosoi CBS 271.37]
MAVKIKKLAKEEGNIKRWQSEGNMFPQIMKKAMKNAERLREEIIVLHNKRTSIRLSPREGHGTSFRGLRLPGIQLYGSV